MARIWFVLRDGNADHQGLMELVSSGGLFLLCMIFMTLSIISMVIFACADHNSGSRRKKKGDLVCGGCGGGGGCGCGGGGCGGGGGGGCGCGGGGGCGGIR